MVDSDKPETPSEAMRKLQHRRKSTESSGDANRYEVLNELGRGGVGVVFRGRDIDLGREVAMKVLNPQFLEHGDVLDRFVEEAQIGGQLQHPGIVPVYEIGLQHDERPFIAMKLIKGETLWTQLSKRTDLADERQRFLAAFHQICLTMAYAHDRKVVHRDLKPENVMIGSFGEVQVVDWGFAKVLSEDGPPKTEQIAGSDEPPQSVIETVRSRDDSGSKSMLGSVLGTPAYMPREQALGDTERMNRRSDVFGLGGILCEILTGTPPYLGSGQEALLKAARAELGDTHRRLDECRANASLIDLCKRCLQPDPEQRPADAQAVADEIAAFLASVEQRAREAEIKAAEARVRARATVMLSAAALLLVLVGGGGYLYLQQARAERVEEATLLASEARAAASLTLGEARSAGFADEAIWQRAVDKATQAQRLGEAEHVTPAEQQRVAALVNAITSEADTASLQRRVRAQDLKMARDLIEVYTSRGLDSRQTTRFDIQVRNDRQCDELFREYLGADLDELSVDDAVARLRKRAIPAVLSAGLDNWAYSRTDAEKHREDATGAEHIWNIATAFDAANPERTALRKMLRTREYDADSLLEIAAKADWREVGPSNINLLSAALQLADRSEAAVEVLERGVASHPRSDFLFSRLASLYTRLPAPRYDAAVAAMRTALAIDPNPSYELLIASMLTQSGEQLVAMSILVELTDSYSEHYGVWNQLGLAHMHQAEFARAIECFERSLELRETAASMCNIGLCHVESGFPKKGIPWMRRAVEHQPDYAQGWSNLGHALFRAGELPEAATAIDKALAFEPDGTAAWTVRGTILHQQGRLEQAEASYRRCLEIDPNHSHGLIHLGMLLRETGRIPEAIEAQQRAIEHAPRDPAMHASYATLLLQIEKPQESLDYLAEQRGKVRDTAEFHVTEAHCLRKLGKLEEAEQILLKAQKLFPESSSPSNALGKQYSMQRRLQDALTQFERALEIGPPHAELHSNLSATYNALGKRKQALEHARAAVEANPRNAPAQYNLGQALMQRRKVDEALGHMRAAHRIWTDDQTPFGKNWFHRATVAIFWTTKRGGDEQGALSFLGESSRLRPEIAKVRVLHAMMLFEDDQPLRALPEFEAAAKLDPDDAPTWINMAMCRRKLGQTLLAQSDLHRAEELFGKIDSAFGRKWHKRAQTLNEDLQRTLDRQRAQLPIARGERVAESPDKLVAAAGAAFSLQEYELAYQAIRRACETHPELTANSTNRYRAACYAAKASALPGLAPQERTARRQFSLQHLRKELQRTAGLPRTNDKERARIRGNLEHMQLDGDLAAVRGERAIADMQVDEAKSWRAFWSEAEQLLAEIEAI